MRKRKYIINLFAATALFIGCNESLEDTYSDYTRRWKDSLRGEMLRSPRHIQVGTIDFRVEKRNGCLD